MFLSISVKELLNLVKYFRSYGQLKSITRWPMTAQMGNWEEGGLWRQNRKNWTTHLLGIFTRFLLAYWSIASVYQRGNNMRVLLLTSRSITKPIPPKTRSWPNLCRFSRFQLAITPKVFNQIQNFFHRNAQKNLNLFFRF